MKLISKDKFISEDDISLLNRLIGVTLTSFDFDFITGYVHYNYKDNCFEVAWPNCITLVSHSGMSNIVNIKFGGELELNEVMNECINIRLQSSEKDYSKGGGISMNWFEVSRIDIFANYKSDIINGKFYGDQSNDVRTNFTRAHNCKELEYRERIDEILLLTSTTGQRIMLQGTESINGTIILHFNNEHIARIISNKYHIQSPMKNFLKRLTIE